MKKNKLLVMLVMLLSVMTLSGCGKKTIDVTSEVQVTFSGGNGYGKAEVENEYFWEDEALEIAGIDSIDSFTSLGEALVIESAVQYELTPNENLSNGDEVVLSVSIDESVLEDYDFKLKAKEKKFTVAGLPEIQTVDLFENISVTFSGTAPNASAVINNGNTEASVTNVSYRFSDDSTRLQGLDIGDTVKVVAVYDENKLLEAGYVAASNEKEFQVENLDKYVSSASEIPESVIEKMTKQFTDALTADAAERWKDPDSIKDIEYIGNYFLSMKKDASAVDNNYFYAVYRICVSNEEGEFSYYSYCRFKNIMVLADGTCTVNLMDYVMPYGSYFWGVSGEAFKQGSYYYIGYQELDSMFNYCVARNAENYEYENNVIDE